MGTMADGAIAILVPQPALFLLPAPLPSGLLLRRAAARPSTGAKCRWRMRELTALLPCKPDRAERDLPLGRRAPSPVADGRLRGRRRHLRGAPAPRRATPPRPRPGSAPGAPARARSGGRPLAAKSGSAGRVLRARRHAGAAGRSRRAAPTPTAAERGARAAGSRMRSATAAWRSTRPRCWASRPRPMPRDLLRRPAPAVRPAPCRIRHTWRCCTSVRFRLLRAVLPHRPGRPRIIDARPPTPHEQHLHHRPLPAGPGPAAVRAACLSRLRAGHRRARRAAQRVARGNAGGRPHHARSSSCHAPRSQVLVLADVFGATPCNVAQKLVDGARSRLVAGVNLPMLLRAVTYRHEPLDALVQRAVAGGTAGVMQVAVAAPQNQARRKHSDQDIRDHQQ